MKIPSRFQVLDSPIALTYADQERLGVHLSNGNRLNEVMLLGISESDLAKLIILEVMGKNRKRILDRLLPQFLREQRKRIEGKIEVLRGIGKTS